MQNRRFLLLLALGAVAGMVVAVAAGAWQARQQNAGSHSYTNRLIHETSPYLLMHAHNPVDWYPWGPEAFAKAKQEGKPIFLSIGYSSCHWCHVMERESFEDEGIARLLNDHFVAIKVDREQRPDLDEIYMTAVQRLTGSGGWPMTTLLTPDGKPFFGGTYFPRAPLAELLEKAHAAWTDPAQHPKLEQLAERVAAGIGQASVGGALQGDLSPTLIRNAVRSYLADFDPKNGGFGRAPKFPPSMQLMLMLGAGGHPQGAPLRADGHPQGAPLRAVTFTLEHMARGGMYDQVGGGFHRYSTDERWLVPHFEKMLYDNALLATLYLDSYETTRNPYYRRIGTEILDFALRKLRDPKGGFWSTLDADSGGGEGQFYLWTPAQVVAVLGKTDGALFNRIYGITPQGNFEGKSIPNLLAKPVEVWARERHTTSTALWERLDGMRAKLRAARDRRPRPPVDDKVLASWNGLMLRALARGYQATGEERFRQAAEQEASFLLTTMRRDGKLVHSYRQGRIEPQVFLDDYSDLIVGLLDLHDALGAGEPQRGSGPGPGQRGSGPDPGRWLSEARSLTRTMGADFWDERDGTFFTTPSPSPAGAGPAPRLVRLKSAEDNAVPSGTSMAALALVRLSRLTNDAGLREKARRVLETHAGTMRQYPQALPQMLLAAEALFTPADTAVAMASRKGPVTVTLMGVPAAVRAGQAFTVGVRFTIQPGWHINAAKPVDAALIATQVEPAAGPFRLLAAIYPAAQTARLGFSREPLSVYTGDTTVRLRLQALPGAEKGRALRLRVRYQACSDRACLLPVETLLTAAPPARSR
jgi:uncharacterized protein YyaL (SSP411 family)